MGNGIFSRKNYMLLTRDPVIVLLFQPYPIQSSGEEEEERRGGRGRGRRDYSTSTHLPTPAMRRPPQQDNAPATPTRQYPGHISTTMRRPNQQDNAPATPTRPYPGHTSTAMRRPHQFDNAPAPGHTSGEESLKTGLSVRPGASGGGPSKDRR